MTPKEFTRAFPHHWLLEHVAEQEELGFRCRDPDAQALVSLGLVLSVEDNFGEFFVLSPEGERYLDHSHAAWQAVLHN